MIYDKEIDMELLIGIMIPFLGTALGSACVFFLKNELKPLVQKALLGFASGVMEMCIRDMLWPKNIRICL